MTYHLFVDHNHSTGNVRGLLCSPCNAFIGHLKDDVTLIQNAIDYLNKDSTCHDKKTAEERKIRKENK